ncbi:MAG: tetratricopeptide repeat protein [Pontiellaceae bacterium]|jgi:TolA-binding protein|nr:tetratricopeptide repeat protein [Pontiellaceae bacterium]
MKNHGQDPKHEELRKQHELEAGEVQEVLNFLKRYGKQIAIGVCAVLVVTIVSGGITHYKKSRQIKVDQLLMDAETPQELEDIVNKYSSMPAAQTALLNLAKTFFNNGEVERARAQYERFLKDYKQSENAPVAEMGLAYCTEAVGDFDNAAEQFSAFVKKHSAIYLRPQAILSIARCKKQAGKIDEARVVLEDFLAGNPGIQWANDAEAALQHLESK